MFISVLLFPCLAVGEDAQAILRKVDRHYNHLHSLQARYTEHYNGMGMDRTECGTLLLEKPGRMRWSYDIPSGKLFIINGKDGWFYTPGNPQAQHLPAKQLDDLRSPLRFLLGRTQLERELNHLTINLITSGYEIAGVPQYTQQRLKLLRLRVDKDGLIFEMMIEEQDGSSTTFTFSELQENLVLPEAKFHFTAPPGVTLVEGLPPL